MKKWLMLPLLPLLPLLLVQQEAGATRLADTTFRSTQTIGTSTYAATFTLYDLLEDNPSNDPNKKGYYDKMHYDVLFTGVDLRRVPSYPTGTSTPPPPLSLTSLMQFYLLNFMDTPILKIVDLEVSSGTVSNISPLSNLTRTVSVSGNTITGDYTCTGSDASCLLNLSFEENKTCMQLNGMTGACEDNPAGMKPVSSIPVANSLMLLGIGLMALLSVPSRRTWLS